MEIRLLGPVEVVDDDAAVPLGARKLRALLAILALRRGQTVGPAAIVDGLWGDEPPPTAHKTVQMFVSRLRRVLGDAAITTQPGGYRLEADPTDLERFEELAARGRAELGKAEFEVAAQTLGTALALWHGTALADLDGEPVHTAEAPRMEELRIAALEDRLDAEIGAGRHAGAVGELERLVAAEPLRERPRAALMLALHRSGRSPDALAAYRAWSRTLDEELGLTPSAAMRTLEGRILRQDTALDVPAVVAPTVAAATAKRQPRRQRRRRPRRWPAAAVAGLGAAAIAVLATSGGGSAEPLRLRADAVVELDPVSGAVRAVVPIGSQPVAVAIGAGAVWVADAGDRTLARVDPRTRAVVARYGLGAIPSKVVATGDAVWVASPLGLRGTVSRIDPSNGTAAFADTVRVGDDGDAFAPPTPSALAVGYGATWTNRARSKLTRLTPSGRRSVVDLGPAHSVDGLATAFGSVWVASSADDRLLRVDPRTLAVTASVNIAARRGARLAGPLDVAAGAGALWVADAISGTVSRISPALGVVTATIPVGSHPTRIAARTDGVWVLTDSWLVRIDPRTRAVTRRVRVPGATGVAVGPGGVWITARRSVAGGQAPVPRPVDPERPLAQSCRAVLGPPGAPPDVTVVSELPTNNGSPDSRSSADARLAMRLVLRGAGFHAGHHAIAYEECDDSTRSALSPTPERCAAAATAYAGAPSLIGIVGPYTSGCAGIELPVLDGAPGGPIPVVAPTTSYVGLTRPGVATDADEPGRYYPAGVRNLVRLVGADDRQAVAIGLLARRLGARRVAILDDGQGTGYAVRRYLELAASRLRLTIASSDSWAPRARGYRALAGRVKAARPQAVVVTGCACLGGFTVVRDLRRTLGAAVPIIASDNLVAGDHPLAAPIARAVAGTYVTIAGRAPEDVVDPARALVRRVAAGRPLTAIDPIVSQSAIAMATLLDAIGRSNGSRAGVLGALHHGPIRLPPATGIRFGADGDPVVAPFAVFRFDPSVPFRASRRAAGLRFVRTIVPPQ